MEFSKYSSRTWPEFTDSLVFHRACGYPTRGSERMDFSSASRERNQESTNLSAPLRRDFYAAPGTNLWVWICLSGKIVFQIFDNLSSSFFANMWNELIFFFFHNFIIRVIIKIIFKIICEHFINSFSFIHWKTKFTLFSAMFINCLATVLNTVSFSFSFSCWKIFECRVAIYIHLRNKTNIFFYQLIFDHILIS